MSNKRKVLLSGKHIPHFRIISKSRFPWNYLLVSKYLCAVLVFVNERKVDVKEFQVKN